MLQGLPQHRMMHNVFGISGEKLLCTGKSVQIDALVDVGP
jgi:hypothetical protein